MRCPQCHSADTKVIDSRESDEGSSIRRRRSCPSCAHRFTTYERVEAIKLHVVKTHGAREPFDRVKIIAGVAAASKGRPVQPDLIMQLAADVEDELRSLGGEITSSVVGRCVLDRLRRLDEVAYLRFASVYKNFDAAADFHRELELMEKLPLS